MHKQKVRDLIKYLNKVHDNIPSAYIMHKLKDMVSDAIKDLSNYVNKDMLSSKFFCSLEFAKAVPVFTDFHSDAFNDWLISDEKYIVK